MGRKHGLGRKLTKFRRTRAQLRTQRTTRTRNTTSRWGVHQKTFPNLRYSGTRTAEGTKRGPRMGRKHGQGRERKLEEPERKRGLQRVGDTHSKPKPRVGNADCGTHRRWAKDGTETRIKAGTGTRIRAKTGTKAKEGG